ncbi:HAD family hydrolase [Patescibacteria group bacterium]
MKIVFDFDHTLFSTRKFYQALVNSFGALGVKESLFQKTFKKSKGKSQDYKPYRQFKLIVKEKPELNPKKLEKLFKKAFSRSKHFLYSDVLPFFKKKKGSLDFILLSYGEDWFQREKIKTSKIEKYFKKIIITQDIDKVKPLKKILQDKEKIVFIDDNPKALYEIKKTNDKKKSNPEIITIRMNRGEGRYAKSPNNSKIDFSIKSLKELEKILNSLQK